MAMHPGRITHLPTDRSNSPALRQLAIVLSKNGQHHARMKHIDVWFHFICEAVENGSISLVYCPTGLMVADLLTKPLNHLKTREHAAGLGLLPA